MSDFVGGLFGSGGSEGTAGEVVDLTPKEFEELRPLIADFITFLLTSGGGPQFGGDLAAGVTGREMDIVRQLSGGFGEPSELFGQSQDLLGRTIGGDFLSPESNPFLQQTIDAATRPVKQAFEEFVIPNLETSFSQAGQQIQSEGSLPFLQEVSKAGRDLTKTIGDISSNITSANFARERAIQSQAPAAATALESGQIQNLVATLQAVALPRLIEDLGIERGLAQFSQRIRVLLSALGIGAQISSPTGVLIPPTGGTAGAPGGLGDLLKGIGALRTSFG